MTKLYEDLVRDEAGRILQRTSFWGMVLGFGAGASLLAFTHFGLLANMQVPTYWSVVCGLFATLAYLIGRAGIAQGLTGWLVVLGYTSLPTVLFVMAEATLPSGAATYINGPPLLVYFVAIAISGFTLRPIVSVAAGALGAGGYILLFSFSADALRDLHHPDPLLLQDLTAPPLYLMKGLMIFFGGVMTAVVARHGRSLLGRIIEKDRERESIHRMFGEYVSAEVRDRLISDRPNGERREVAVLFSDLRGFSSFSEEYPPERVVMHLNEYLDRMVAAIHAAGGTVDKFIGDAIMAVFGGLVPLDEPCAAALDAARRMRAGVAELNEEWARVGLAGLENGIGIHFGEVLMGSIGSRERKDFTVIGDAVNVAARLEGLTRQHAQAILISDSVRSRLANEAGLVSLGSMAVKGRREPVQVYGVGPDSPGDGGPTSPEP